MDLLKIKVGKVIFAIAFFSLLSFQPKAQRYAFGAGIGGTNYIGDLSTTIEPQLIDLSYGAWFEYHYNPYWSFRTGVNFGAFAGADSLSSFQHRKNRNLSFRTEYREIYAVGQIHFFDFVPDHVLHVNHTPYIYFGFGLASHSPMAQYKGEWYDLRELRTEGQRPGASDGNIPYPNITAFIPLGIGYKYNFYKQHTIGVELGSRIVLSDYMDDVSRLYEDNNLIEERSGEVGAALADRSPELGLPLNEAGKMRGNEKFNDWYFYLGATYIYTIKGNNCPSSFN